MNSIIYKHIKQLFSLIIKHWHVPYRFILGLIVPIIQDKLKDVRDTNNYKPILIMAILSKLLETCVFARYKDKLGSSGLQFELFREKGCTFKLYNVVNYYLEKSSNVCLVSLNAAEALDYLNTNELLNVLVKWLLLVVIGVLLNWFGKSCAFVKVKGCLSDEFHIGSGVE